MAYQTYYLRTRPEKYDRLLELGQTMGVITLTYTDSVSGEPVDSDTPDAVLHIGSQIGSWDYIGEIRRPTGETTLDEDGNEIPVTEIITDVDGIPFIHVNFRTETDLLDLAQKLALDNPDIAEGLAEVSSYFVSENGELVAPKNPVRIFLGE